jgi:hypothetical protein
MYESLKQIVKGYQALKLPRITIYSGKSEKHEIGRKLSEWTPNPEILEWSKRTQTRETPLGLI